MAIIKTRGIWVDMPLDIAPDVYVSYVTTYRKGIKQLITQYMNVIYGNMGASILIYYKFCKTLKLNKSKMNTYDTCVTNRLVNRLKQYTLFHVDYCKKR